MGVKSQMQIDHNDMSVAEHWNEYGHNQTQEERNDWYDDPNKLKVLCRACNAKKNQYKYDRKVGSNFKGPKD